MAFPHPALLDLAAGRPVPAVPDAELDVLLQSAVEHRVSGLLWSRVLAGELALPATGSAALAKQDLRSSSRNLQLWRTLGDVVQRLGDIGVEVAVAKGISTEARWYARTGERPCNDLDLLLAPAAITRIEEVVHLLHPGHPLEHASQRLMVSGLLQSIDLDVGPVEVDLHTDLLKFEVPTRHPDALFDATVPIEGPGGVRALALSPEHSLVHFLLHLNKDNFARLLGYADVARILGGADLDWVAVDRFVTGEGLGVHVYSALHEVTSRLGLPAAPAPVPRGARAALWQTLWPPENRLGGRAGFLRQRHRHLVIPWTAEGRLSEAAAWWWRRRLLPPPALVDLYYADTSGPYPVRLAMGRWTTARRNRRLASGSTPSPRREAVLRHYKTFPPRWTHIQVPLSSTPAAQSALALYAPCLRGGTLIRDAAWAAVTSLGPHALPGRSRPLDPPVPPELWEQMLERWTQEVGPFDDLAVHARAQEHRTGFAVLLLREGAAVSFVRVNSASAAAFERERHVLDLCESAVVAAFWHPRTLAGGTVAGWAYLAMTALPPQRHRPSTLPIDDVLRDLRTALAGLPRPAEVPAHWEPMHGDLTPWNCRDLPGGRRALIDWEDAQWAPPGADRVLFQATVAALWGQSPGEGPQEAIAFWQDRIALRAQRARDPISHQTLAALARMRPLGSAA